MEPPPTTSASPGSETPQRHHSWEAYSIAVATIIGLLSLAVSAYTAYTLHVQTRAQVFPYLQIVVLGDQHRVGMYNKGVGPAFVKSVRLAVGGEPVTTWPAFFAALKLKMDGGTTYSNVNHAAIAANETLPALSFADAADFRSFASIDPSRYRVDVCYCSVLDECWTFAQALDVDSDPRPVSRCAIDRSRDFTQ